MVSRTRLNEGQELFAQRSLKNADQTNCSNRSIYAISPPESIWFRERH